MANMYRITLKDGRTFEVWGKTIYEATLAAYSNTQRDYHFREVIKVELIEN